MDHWGISGGSLMVVVVAYLGAAVVHIGSSVGSLVVTPDCKPAVLGSNLAISLAYSRLPVLRWAAFWKVTSL
jgi:hypothetical protein